MEKQSIRDVLVGLISKIPGILISTLFLGAGIYVFQLAPAAEAAKKTGDDFVLPAYAILFAISAVILLVTFRSEVGSAIKSVGSAVAWVKSKVFK